ncbi:MAG: hypothetical protein ACXWP1_10105 [Bdellovibrionota bacterium]
MNIRFCIAQAAFFSALLIPPLAHGQDSSIFQQVVQELGTAKETHQARVREFTVDVATGSWLKGTRQDSPAGAEIQKPLRTLIDGTIQRINTFSQSIQSGVSARALNATNIDCGARNSLAEDLSLRKKRIMSEREFYSGTVVPEVLKDAQRVRARYINAKKELGNNCVRCSFHDDVLFATSTGGADLAGLDTKIRNADSFLERHPSGYFLTLKAVKKLDGHLKAEEDELTNFESTLLKTCPAKI